MNSQFHGNLLSTQYQDMQDESKTDMLPRARENRVSLNVVQAKVIRNKQADLGHHVRSRGPQST
jgi:hypothetical protein